MQGAADFKPDLIRPLPAPAAGSGDRRECGLDQTGIGVTAAIELEGLAGARLFLSLAHDKLEEPRRRIGTSRSPVQEAVASDALLH
jgi:hypothetical protein